MHGFRRLLALRSVRNLVFVVGEGREMVWRLVVGREGRVKGVFLGLSSSVVCCQLFLSRPVSSYVLFIARK